MENEQIIIKNAQEAATLAERSQKQNSAKAINMIHAAAQQGFTECVFFFGLGMNEVSELMSLGFAISTFVHPMDGNKLYKASW